jgi:phenylacetate-CoA ligase
MSLAKTIFTTGAAKRNPELFDRYQFLKSTEKWSLDQLKAYQLQELKKLLTLADKHSAFYREYFKKHGFDPHISSLDDLKQLPPVSKALLISENDQIHTDLNFDKKFFCETSGSSGHMLSFWRDEPWDSANRAAIMRGHSWYDVNLWDKNLYFWGYNIDPGKRLKTRFLDGLQNRYRLFDYSEKTLRGLVKRLDKTIYIHGYASMIHELAVAIKENDLQIEIPRLKMIKGTSEKIYPHYQEAITSVFGKPMVSEYGAAEASIVAFECPHGKMHITMENVIVEEEDGEIVVTNLVAESFPIIRYKLGDYIKLSEGQSCSCGMAHPVLAEVEGRVGKNIYGTSQKYPSLTLYYVFKNLFFDKGLKFNYQCIQEEKGRLEVLIKEPFSQQAEKYITMEFDKYFKDDLSIKISFSQDFHSYQEKLKDFISKID